MIHTGFRKTSGFTLTELLVVIGIMTVLMALIVPATRSLSRGNRVQRCSLQLQQIGNALKAYHLDYRGVPPVYIFETGTGWDDPSPTVPDTLDPNDEIDDEGTEPYNNGLHILFETGYLHSRRALHCPQDKDYSDPNEAEYYASYATLDEKAKVKLKTEGYDHDYWINRYKYMPCRTWKQVGEADTDEDKSRQLAPNVEPVWIHEEDRWAWAPVAGAGVSWYPDDTTVVTWCNLHVKDFKRTVQTTSGATSLPMYQVLYWDGSVRVKPAPLLRDDPNDEITCDIDAAWKVRPDDTVKQHCNE